jgi:hypothetical protein
MSPREIDRHREFLRCFTAQEAAIRAYVRRLVPLRADADDVMQEVAVVVAVVATLTALVVIRRSHSPPEPVLARLTGVSEAVWADRMPTAFTSGTGWTPEGFPRGFSARISSKRSAPTT